MEPVIIAFIAVLFIANIVTFTMISKNSDNIKTKANNLDFLEKRFNLLPDVRAARAEAKIKEAKQIIDLIGEK